MVYVYNDEGVSQNALHHTLHTLKKVLGKKYKIETIDAKEIILNTWPSQTALFIMPGGADLGYLKKLNGAGNENIKAYVKQGGSYLGMCAGAYYAASNIEFDKGGALEVLGHRPLSFFQGTVIGPVLAPYDYQSQRGARAANITLNLPHVKEASVYYNGGGYFEHTEKMPLTHVIGRYTNQLPAIIAIRYGQGHVVLSGVHFEYDPTLLDDTDPFLKKIIPQLKHSEKERRVLVHEILNVLGIQSTFNAQEHTL